MPRRTVDAAQPRKSVDAVISRRSESVKPLSESVDAAQPHQSTQRKIIKYIRRGYIYKISNTKYQTRFGMVYMFFFYKHNAYKHT